MKHYLLCGNVKLSDYKGKWLVFFSHPGDFTPICTTEIIGFAKAYTYFKKINTELLGISIDSLNSHLAWLYDIYLKTGLIVNFPIIADSTGSLARKYGMISNEVSNSETVRNVIAFPMNSRAQDLLMNAPSEVTQKQLDEVHIKINLKNN